LTQKTKSETANEPVLGPYLFDCVPSWNRRIQGGFEHSYGNGGLLKTWLDK
jgi:hypothetical protein